MFNDIINFRSTAMLPFFFFAMLGSISSQAQHRAQIKPNTYVNENAGEGGAGFSRHAITEKKVVIPRKLLRENYFGQPDSKYAENLKRESPNFAIFWDKSYGTDPENNSDKKKRFNISRMLSECERYFDYYVNTLHILKKGSSASDTYKILFFVTGGDNTTAYGWGHDSVGVLWSPSSRVEKEPFGVLAHELGHVFQFLASVDNGGTAFQGPVNEMGAQYVLWQVLPDWLSFENYHLKAFLARTHLAFLHPENGYHSPFVIEYWASLHGPDIYGRLLREVKRGEDIAITYKRITATSQQQFNDQLFDAARHFVTWDLKRVDEIASPYRNQHYTPTLKQDEGWYAPEHSSIPQAYGYNAIELSLPVTKPKIRLEFEGSPAVTRGWRYGFLAYSADGKRHYSTVHLKPSGEARFTVPENTSKLWLLVMGAPAEHVRLKGTPDTYTRYPYKFRLTGTQPSPLSLAQTTELKKSK